MTGVNDFIDLTVDIFVIQIMDFLPFFIAAILNAKKRIACPSGHFQSLQQYLSEDMDISSLSFTP
jgi:hypothetical protein